jgi:hypothetical protein
MNTDVQSHFLQGVAALLISAGLVAIAVLLYPEWEVSSAGKVIMTMIICLPAPAISIFGALQLGKGVQRIWSYYR